ncbi:MAG: hypothetical protein CMB72_02785 [Euryarchaeota archaeon]|nr:hypothetical protein [Euryarchaeota archaeon]|tara:strand:- start:996 stop:1409 length:414 start_codon:yes stop_codon:yes gene_type:complete
MNLESSMDVVLIKVKDLRPHEEIKPKNLEKMINWVEKRGGFFEPVLVDIKTRTILDGHHRYNSALHLGLKLIPGIEVDYLEDDSIQVKAWPGKEEIIVTKQSVLSIAESGNLFPPKTSKHTISIDYPQQFFPLEKLR